MEFRSTGSLPDEPPENYTAPLPQMSNAHHALEPVHTGEVQAYLQEHVAPAPRSAPQQPTGVATPVAVAIAPVEDDPSRVVGGYEELIGAPEKTIHDIAYHEPKVTVHAYALLFLSITTAVLQAAGNVVVLVVCVAMFVIGVRLLLTKSKQMALKLMLATLAIELLLFGLYAIYPETRIMCIFVGAMIAYTIYTIRDVNDVA